MPPIAGASVLAEHVRRISTPMALPPGSPVIGGLSAEAGGGAGGATFQPAHLAVLAEASSPRTSKPSFSV
jgi:hypothetical protein